MSRRRRDVVVTTDWSDGHVPPCSNVCSDSDTRAKNRLNKYSCTSILYFIVWQTKWNFWGSVKHVVVVVLVDAIAPHMSTFSLSVAEATLKELRSVLASSSGSGREDDVFWWNVPFEAAASHTDRMWPRTCGPLRGQDEEHMESLEGLMMRPTGVWRVHWSMNVGLKQGCSIRWSRPTSRSRRSVGRSHDIQKNWPAPLESPPTTL